jgi:hypothetical protein
MTSDMRHLIRTPARWILLSGAIILFSPIVIKSQSPVDNVTQYRGAFAKETLTVTNAVKTLTNSVYNPTVTGRPSSQTRADYALITVESDCLRYWPTSANPTTTQGHKACDGAAITVYGYNNILNWKAIRVTTDVTIQVSYYRFSSNTP